MAYIGRTVEYGNASTDSFVGNGGATYTLTYDTITNGVVVSLDGVIQKNGTDFNITGTSLVFTSVVSSPVVIQVIYLGLSLSLGTVADSTITSAKIANGTIVSTDIDSTFLATLTSQASPEVYGFSTNANGNLIVTTTNAGVDAISSTTYDTFDDVIYAVSGFTWSLVGTQLRCTI